MPQECPPLKGLSLQLVDVLIAHLNRQSFSFEGVYGLSPKTDNGSLDCFQVFFIALQALNTFMCDDIDVTSYVNNYLTNHGGRYLKLCHQGIIVRGLKGCMFSGPNVMVGPTSGFNSLVAMT